MSPTDSHMPHPHQQQNQQQQLQKQQSSNSAAPKPAAAQQAPAPNNSLPGQQQQQRAAVDADGGIINDKVLKQKRLPQLRTLLTRLVLLEGNNETPVTGAGTTLRKQSTNYIQAVKQSSHTAERESNPLAFLRVCQGNVTTAARMILAYWDKRVQIFGEPRAFQPLTQLDGNGALTLQEVAMIHSGCIVVPLPPDKAGSMVLLCNDNDAELSRLARLNANSDVVETEQEAKKRKATCALKILFYWLHVVADKPESQHSGFVYLRVVQSDANQSSSFQTGWIHHELIKSTFPVKIKAAHFCLVQKHPLSQHETARLQACVQQTSSSAAPMLIHSGTPSDHILPILQKEKYGLEAANLPTSVGGQIVLEERLRVLRNSYQQKSPDVDRKIVAMDVDNDDNVENLKKQEHAGNKTAVALPRQPSAPPDKKLVSTDQHSHHAAAAAKHNNSNSHHAAAAAAAARDNKNNHHHSISKYAPLRGRDKERALQSLESAIADMSAVEKKPLMDAWTAAPKLFQTECDPLVFLSVCEYNAVKAARRLCNYWRERERIFGKRKYLSMNQTGTGVLSENDLVVLQSGFVAPIFKQNVIVLRFNRSFQDETLFSVASRLRCIFYVLTVLSKTALTTGYTCLRIMSTRFRANMDQDMKLIVDTFPMRLLSLHIACMPPAAGLQAFRDSFMPVMAASLGDKLKGRTLLHVESSPKEMFDQLQKHGLTKSVVPAELGGEWTLARFEEWRKDRLLHEQHKLLNEETAKTMDVLGALAERELVHIGKGDCSDKQPPAAVPLSNPGTSGKVSEIDMAMEKLPLSITGGYLEAKARVPALVQKESPAAQFLVFTRMDAKAAALRLASYWKQRIELFVDRAFLPLNQTGEGALGRDDMNLLCGGFLVLLPESDSGHSVLCYDGSRVRKAPGEMQLRVAFYYFSLLAENPKSQREGFSVLHLMDKLVNQSRDRRQSFSGLLTAFPIRIKEVHAIPSAAIRANEIVIRNEVALLFGKNTKGKVISYASCPTEVLATRLEQCGLPQQVTPKVVGGLWGYENFVRWQELRTRYEWDLPMGNTGNNPSQDRDGDDDASFDFSSVKTDSSMDEAERAEKQRRLDILKSRRKRERERVEIEVLQEQCTEYERKNRALFEDNMRMEKIMSSARKKITRMTRRSSNTSASANSNSSASESFGHRVKAAAPPPLVGLTPASPPVARPAIAAPPLVGLPVAASAPNLDIVSGNATTQELEALLQQELQQQRIAEHQNALREMRIRHALEERRLQEQMVREATGPALVPPSQQQLPASLFQPPINPLQQLNSQVQFNPQLFGIQQPQQMANAFGTAHLLMQRPQIPQLAPAFLAAHPSLATNFAATHPQQLTPALLARLTGQLPPGVEDLSDGSS